MSIPRTVHWVLATILLVQSVVLMPVPTFSTWAMEEWLEPWVHYIPLKDDLSNVEERVQWVRNHDKEAQAISRRATLWMMDMVYHRHSDSDDISIRSQILARYQTQWSEDVHSV